MKLKTTEKHFLKEYCDGVGDGPFYKNDLLSAFRRGRFWNISNVFMDVNKHRPKAGNRNIVIILQLGTEFPYDDEYEFAVIKECEYDDFIARTPYKPLYWFRLSTILSILNHKKANREGDR